MTDAPERIWAEPDYDHGWSYQRGEWFNNTDDPASVQFVRADHALALVAEAYEVAARECEPLGLGPSIRTLTASDAIAACEARDKRVRDEALRDAAAAIKEHTDTARKKMKMVYAAPVWSAIISHLDVEHDRILALIEGDQTDE